jgi:TatD DNase family protein
VYLFFEIIITAGTHHETIQALDLCSRENVYTTCGYHPTRCNEFNESNADEIVNQMIELCRKNSEKIVAIGEFGLDYERTQFCDIEQQKR